MTEVIKFLQANAEALSQNSQLPLRSSPAALPVSIYHSPLAVKEKPIKHNFQIMLFSPIEFLKFCFPYFKLLLSQIPWG